MRARRVWGPIVVALIATVGAGLGACGDDAPPPATGVTTERCDYQPLVPTARAGGTVAAAALQAGAAEHVLDVPVGTALGGYTSRAGFLGASGTVDTRRVPLSGAFNPSIGVTAAPRVKVVALTAGDETVVIVKVDMIFTYEGMVYDLEQRLGPEYAGKVLISASHSHSAWAQFTGHGPLKLGAGELRALVYKRFVDTMETTAREALAARRPAKLGGAYDPAFDPTGLVNHDRRGDNDMLPGGDRKDDHMFLLRVDGTDDTPIAVMVVFGEHGTLNGEDNPLASSDATGALERVFAERFTEPVVVMHLQGAGGDNSPAGHGGLDCDALPGKPGDPCFGWASEEGHGRAAAPLLETAWTAAGTAMRASIELEMLTRSIETGPFPDTMKLRDGALGYAPFDGVTEPDGVIFDGTGAIAAPVDEFNAPVGAALCEAKTAMFPNAAIPGTEGLPVYGSCLRLDLASEVLGPIFDIDFKVDATHPVCETTRTTISALRLGDYVIGTMPGELTVMLAQYVRDTSGLPADKTIILGYAQGHVGYMLRPEDWLQGGYEPSVTFWGPLEAEHVANELLALLPLASTPMREDGTTATARVAVPTMVDELAIDNPAPAAGTVPTAVPVETWSRIGTPAAAQPAAQIPRVSGIATFTWYGDDPQVKTPHVTLLRETSPDVFVPATRRSSRVVDDAELVLAYTPVPLQRGSGPQHHVWVVEWQAVPWLGLEGLDGLGDRGGLPLGRYRFRVEGSSWALDSNPFEVVAGGLELGTAARAAGVITTTVTWHAPKGWRLLDMTQKSNTPIAVGAQPVTIALLGTGGAQLSSTTVTTDATGVAQVADNALALEVKITDRFGNTATRALP